MSILLSSCSKPIGIWDDNIKLSIKTVDFEAHADSILITTGGSTWTVSDVSVDDNWFCGFQGVNLKAESYIIKEDCFNVQRRDKHTLFIKVEKNPLTVKRIITVGLAAGDYFDRVTITQKPK
jgi:hypothetical protein